MTGSTPHNPFLEVVLAALFAELMEHPRVRPFMGNNPTITDGRRRDGYAFLALLIEAMRDGLTEDMRTAISRAAPDSNPDRVWNVALDAALGRPTAH